MRNKINCFLLFLFLAFTSRAQTWLPVSTGITGTASNTTWSLFTYDSILYAGGWFNNAGGTPVNDFAQWNGTSWAVAGTGSVGYVNAMALYNGNLYAGGEFDTMSGVIAHDIAMWNGSAWASVGKGLKDVQYGVYTMAVYKGSLYAGGSFDSAGGNLIYGIAQWDGSNWSKVGTGIYAADEDDGVFALTVYNGDLYVGGNFDSAGGVKVHSIAKWDGSTWSSVGGSVNGAVYSLAVYNGNLYVGGFFDTAGVTPANNIVMWNGSSWTALDSGITGEAGWASANAMAVYNSELYVGGSFDTVNGKYVNAIASWNGTKWSSLGSGINSSGSVDAMAVYNNALYVGGGFDSAGGVYAKNIAMWTGPTAVHEISDNNSISVYPNPVSNILSVQTQNITNGIYSIYNEMGQKVENGNLDSSQKINIDVSTFSTGIYVIHITSSSGKGYSRKFVKN